jgi:(1->4)-alpha-D-glucan 1-alpha-D-glucosylmutase
MGLLLDIVPNHMSASSENPWWTDVLENGPNSPYAPYFDIDWSPATNTVENKVILPLLGRPYRSVLENQEVVLTLDENGFHIRYYEMKLPLQPKSYRKILVHRIVTLEEALGTTHPAFLALVDLINRIQRLPVQTAIDPKGIEESQRAKQAIKHRLWHLYQAHPEVKRFIDENVRIFNGTKGDPHSFDLLDQLLGDQAYQLGFWRVVREKMNYRRFFDINDLISVRVEDARVFEATHGLIFKLIKAGNVTGLRADHIDGLYDPLEYFQRLQASIAPEAQTQEIPPRFYVVVEKILIGDEALPEDWPVHGTTGYEFIKAVNMLFVDSRGIRTLDRVYTRFTGTGGAFQDVVYHRKKQVIEALFMGEVRSLGYHLGLLADQDRRARNITSKERLQVLVEAMACLPVYRTYIRDFEVAPQDRFYIERAVEEAKRRNPSLGAPIFEFLRRVLLLDFPASLSNDAREACLWFVRRWQQFTGPIMAKGLEDTSLYVYNRLISLNEVGGDPAARGLSVEAFHRHNVASGTRWPYTMNATSTHDTKRSEDVRARINVLSELPGEWAKRLRMWSHWNRPQKRQVNGKPVPDPNEEMLLYQTLIGAWPLVKKEVPAFRKRLKAYMIKAAKEAKVHTSWIDPNADYEQALVAFVDSILKASNRNKFLPDFLRFQKQTAFYGAFNALAQVLLKLASPGVPDFYQGTELWDFSLVDPDNRRPVDFTKRARFLQDLKRREKKSLLPLIAELLRRWEDGRLKLFVTAKALDFRRTQRELFLEGDYLPIRVLGRRKQHICAFARRKGEKWAVVAAPRLLTRLVRVGKLPVGERTWGTDRLILPRGAPERWLNIFTGETLKVSSASGRKVLPLKSVFQHLPVALLSGVSS